MAHGMRSLVVIALLVGSASANAELIDRGGGMIYDTDLNITWLSDWSLGAGSVYDDGESPTDGLMTWASAEAWARSLRIGGYSDWRLPTTLVPDESCHSIYSSVTCTGSEMGHLFKYELGTDVANTVYSASNVEYLAMFSNFQLYNGYWSSTVWPNDSNFAYTYSLYEGYQWVLSKDVAGGRAIAVRDGDVLPDPAATLRQLLTDVTGVGSGKSLANKVTLAQTYYAVPDIQATCAVMTDFVNEVSAQAGKKKLTATQAATLTSDANDIKVAIGCD